MQRYKRGNWSVACVVSGRSSWQAKGNNATGAKVKAFPMGVGFYFFCCPKLLGQLCSGEAHEGTLSTFECQGFSQNNQKLSTDSSRRCDVDYLLATRHKPKPTSNSNELSPSHPRCQVRKVADFSTCPSALGGIE